MLAPTEEQVTLALPLLDRPFDRDPAFRHRQRPVFDGVGRQFVQRHCQRQGNLRGEPYMGTGGGEAIGIPVLEREQGSIHDITDRRAFDLILDQQLLRGSPTIATSSRQATTAGGSKTGTEPKTPSPGSHPRRLTRWVNRDLPRTPPPAHLTVCVVVRGPLLSTTGITAALPKGGVNIGL